MPYKILVVDDEKEIVELIQDKLNKTGYVTSVAYDGEEALVKVASDNPDVILLDLKLPKKDGFDVVKEVREKYKNKWIPIIIVSANTDIEALKQCYGLEADHYLTKPCDMDKILQGIETMISLIPLRRQGEQSSGV